MRDDRGRRRSLHRGALAALALSLVLTANAWGCGASPSGAEACAAHATSVCDQMQRCAPFDVTRIYGDASVCAARTSARCMANLGANGDRCPGLQGSPCDPADAACDLGHGVSCNLVTHICEKIQLSDANGACGLDLQTGVRSDCRAGLSCTMGACVPGAGDGQACATTPADSCVLGEHCVNSKCSPAEPLCM